MPQSALIFNPTTGLYSPDTADIREAVAADWVEAFAEPGQPHLDTEPTTPAGQLIDSETAIIEDKNAQVLYLASQFNPKVADGRWQDALGFIYFLERQYENPSVVTAQVTGLADTVIPAGALVCTADGVTLAAAEAVTIGAGGTAQVIFNAQEAGPLQIAPHTVTSIVTTVPGWDTVDNAAAGVTGRYRESRSTFERRRAASVAVNAHGTVAALYAAIGSVSGVIDLVVLENFTDTPETQWGVTVPAHGVFISVYGGDDTAIAEAIYRKKDAGADTGGNTEVSYTDPTVQNYRGGVSYTYNIERPAPLAFSIQVSLRLTASTPTTITDDIKASVLADFNGDGSDDRVRMATICYASRFYCPIVSAGVQDLVGVKIAANGSGWIDEITINANQIPVLSINDISVIMMPS